MGGASGDETTYVRSQWRIQGGFVLGRACALEHFGVWRIGAREDDPLGGTAGSWKRTSSTRDIFVKKSVNGESL